MERVVIVGNSGSGKSTLGRGLAAILGCEATELDSIFHQRGWTEIDPSAFREVVTDLASGARWVIDGNYRAVAPITWARADTVIWFDLPRPVVLARVVRRTLSRMIRQSELWNGNKEDWRNLCTLDPERNLIMWSITNHNAYRARYLEAMADPANAHLRIVRLRHRSDATALLDAVRSGDTYTLARLSEQEPRGGTS